MQGCKEADDPTGQKLDPSPLQEMPGKNFEGGEGKAPEQVKEASEVLGENSPPPLVPTQHHEKQSENNKVETFASCIVQQNNRINNNNNNNSEQHQNREKLNPQSQRVSEASSGQLEKGPNSDQFGSQNGKLHQQSIDQYNSQHFQQQQFQCRGEQAEPLTHSRNHQPVLNQNHFQYNQHQNFLFQQQQQNQQINGAGFIPHQHPNFAPQNFYPAAQHPSYQVQNGLPQHNFNSNCFPPGYGGQRQNNSYGQNSSMAENNNQNQCQQFSLRARRRVRQRVDAGEPRNSYSSIPGFSFRHQNMLGRGGGGGDTSGFYRGGGSGVFSMRGRGRHPPGGHPLHPMPPYNPPLPFPRYRHPSLVHSHPPFPIAAAAAVHRALFLGQGGVTSGSPSRGTVLPASGDDTKTVESLLRDETSEKLDVLPPLTTPPTTPPLVDSDITTKVKISSDCNSDPSQVSAASDNNNHTTPSNNKLNQDYNKNITENALLIREYLSSKLAAVTDMMEQGLGLVNPHNGPRDFTQHSLPINNNEFKENHAAQIMSHLLKVRQEMALNMSKDSDSDRQTESPGHISDNDIIEEEKDEPINLHQNGRSSAAGSGSDGETSPASPSSDAGMSTSSAKDQKASRLENIVGGLARSTSSPLPPQGCKKRKLYQPVQHDVNDDEIKENVMKEEPEQKRMKDGLENHIKSMQDQFQKMQQKFHNHNDENADPEDSELQIDLSHEEKKIQREEITIERRVNPKSFSALGHPLLNGSAEPLPLPPSTLNPNYMDLAKRFLQEQQDKVTKELITKDIVHSTIGKDEIADKLAAISPELEGLADILKSEITTSLTIIVDSIVQRFLTQKRQPLGKFSEESLFNQEKPRTPSGRAPQVRDRSTPRCVANPLSMANPLSLSNALNTSNNLIMTGSTAPPRISFPASVSGDMPTKPPMMSLYAPSTNGQMSEDEREEESEQDDALNLVVTPKKKRHKVTDTRITPRTVSRLLGEQPSMAELQKHFGPASPFMPPGFHMPKLLGDLPRPPFHGIPNSFLPHIPTSLAMSNPSLNHPEHFPFSPFGFPGPLNRPRDLSPPRDHNRPRSASPPRDHRPPPPLLHPAILAAQGSDFSSMRHPHNDIDNRPASETSSDDFKFEKMEFSNSPFSLGNISGKLFFLYIFVL